MSQFRALPGFFKGFQSAAEASVPFNAATGLHLEFAAANSWNDLYSTIPDDSKLVIVARHGQGYHNAAEQRYGTKAWDDYWAVLDGDEFGTWDDALLTPTGIQQASSVGVKNFVPIVRELGIPEAFYSSPLRRCLQTFALEWTPVYEAFKEKLPNVIDLQIREGLREHMATHTCDRRLDRYKVSPFFQDLPIANSKLHLNYLNTDPEKDELWTPTYAESTEELDKRVGNALDGIFSEPHKYISITCHSGVIASILRVLDHPKLVSLQTGGLVYLVVRRRV
ncbi:HFL056Cp [Eremothecium sinecaudum]|uniref:HFL056Cp n=1 Tax=Eremothecium sinecaudum TaxID=45286 RepID=A0A0X8HUT6_9SACH|nr:HFL056Cp [Eremothecium sinecaudum]AMD21800.1 HFL056Cp [Eremothecium sinecaudum]